MFMVKDGGVWFKWKGFVLRAASIKHLRIDQGLALWPCRIYQHGQCHTNHYLILILLCTCCGCMLPQIHQIHPPPPSLNRAALLRSAGGTRARWRQRMESGKDLGKEEEIQRFTVLSVLFVTPVAEATNGAVSISRQGDFSPGLNSVSRRGEMVDRDSGQDRAQH